MIDTESCKESLNPVKVYHWVKNRIKFLRENPDYFDADGLVCFCGPQGSGKTLSAVNYVYKLMQKYPNCILVTNIQLRDYPIVTLEEFIKKESKFISSSLQFLGIEDPELTRAWVEDCYRKTNRVFEFRDNDDFSRYENDERGCIFLVDEIQLYLNSLASKNINMDVITQISQQRKQRKHIVCTSQVFGRMAKPLREQFSCVIICKAFFRFLQYNRMIDRDSIDGDDSTGTNLKGTVKQKYIWFHSPDMYKRYDTYYVIERNKFVAGEEQLDIYSAVESAQSEKKEGKK